MIEVNEHNAAETARALRDGALPVPTKSLAEAMGKVMLDVDYVQKTGTVTVGQGYKFAGEAAFIAKIRPALVRHGIVVAPVAMEPLVTEVFQGKSGQQNRIVLKVTFRFTHIPSGQTLDVVTCGEGMDNGDKATNKAMTGAMKYCLRQTFVIETGNDPDETPSSEQERATAGSPPPAKNAAQQQPPSNTKLRAEVVQKLAQAKTADDYHRIRKQIGKDYTDKLLTKADIDAINPVAADTMKRLGVKAQPAAK